MQEGEHKFIFLPSLCINNFKVLGLYCRTPRDGYQSRLFLSERIPGKEGNWSVHQILGKTWHTLSWKIEKNMEPLQLLAEHVRAYR